MRNALLIFFTVIALSGCKESGLPSSKQSVLLSQSATTKKTSADLKSNNAFATTNISNPPHAPTWKKTQINTKLIFDTDIAEDCDDVGAMAVLHALADKGEVDILAMMVSMPVEYGAPALDAINTYFGRPDIPIGTLKNSQDALGAANIDVYNKALSLKFPNDVKHAYHTPNASTLYRQLLASQPDSSVVVITVGPLTNLYHLMKSTSDEFSSLNGIDLIRKKVKRFIMAGGKLPHGSSYNFRLSPDKSEYVINNWPTEHWLVPNELGDSVFTGVEMLSKTSAANPIHVAYDLYRKAHPGWEFRPSWDQMAVYIAARPKDPLFKAHTSGSVKADKHLIRWLREPDKNHIWFQNNSTRDERRKVIEALMSYQPQ